MPIQPAPSFSLGTGADGSILPPVRKARKGEENMSLKLLIALALVCVVTIPAAAQKVPNEGRDMMRQLGGGGLSGKKLAKAIARAEASPLGSKANPIRENMPQGQLAYLRRLRCPDGTKPAFDRQGNVGMG